MGQSFQEPAEKGKQKTGLDDDGETKQKKETPMYSESMRFSVKVMERMVNQNAENEAPRGRGDMHGRQAHSPPLMSVGSWFRCCF